MKTLAALALLMILVAPVVGTVALVFRVDVATWNTAVTVIAVALAVLALCAGIGIALRGWAKVEEARALGVAAEGRRAHGWQPAAPTYNTTVNVLSMRHPETGEVRQLPASDAVQAGCLMRQYAMQGYELELEQKG